jgi:hypothetical protein
VSVVLQPVEPADDEQLDQSIEIIRRRLGDTQRIRFGLADCGRDHLDLFLISVA